MYWKSPGSLAAKGLGPHGFRNINLQSGTGTEARGVGLGTICREVLAEARGEWRSEVRGMKEEAQDMPGWRQKAGAEEGEG